MCGLAYAQEKVRLVKASREAGLGYVRYARRSTRMCGLAYAPGSVLQALNQPRIPNPLGQAPDAHKYQHGPP